MSKRKLLQLVTEKRVEGWDDPRMPTLAGLRRRGVTPEALRDFAELIGIAKNNSVVDIGSSSSPSAVTWKGAPRARWPSSTRSRSRSPTGPGRRSSSWTSRGGRASRPAAGGRFRLAGIF
jgi:hypothetical protein